jgi:predicted DsbA family dithiol-disulfide isomerase
MTRFIFWKETAGEKGSTKMAVKIEFFFSRTCPHCLPTKKMLYEIVKGLGGTVEIEEIDAWSGKGESLAQKYGIQVVPAIVVNGVKCAEGIVDRQRLFSAIKTVLG